VGLGENSSNWSSRKNSGKRGIWGEGGKGKREREAHIPLVKVSLHMEGRGRTIGKGESVATGSGANRKKKKKRSPLRPGVKPGPGVAVQKKRTPCQTVDGGKEGNPGKRGKRGRLKLLGGARLTGPVEKTRKREGGGPIICRRKGSGRASDRRTGGGGEGTSQRGSKKEKGIPRG